MAYDRAEILKSQIGTEFERKIHFYGAGLIDALVHSIHFFQHVDMISFFSKQQPSFENTLNLRIMNCIITHK